MDPCFIVYWLEIPGSQRRILYDYIFFIRIRLAIPFVFVFCFMIFAVS